MAFTNKTLKDGAGADFTAAVWTPGRDAAAASQPVALATEDKAALDLIAPGTKTTSVTPLETGGVGVLGWLSQLWREIKSIDGKTPALGSAVSAGSSPVVIASDQPSIPTIQKAVTSTDKSGTITTAGTAQTAIASNASRKGWMVSNVSTTLMYVNDDGTASTALTGIPVYPGQTVTDGGRCATTAISVLCATAGAAWSAKEYT